jgi:hypothetical protein
MEDTLKDLLILLRAIAAKNPPEWQRPLKYYPKFDWAKIGATAIAHDEHGATAVAWCGHIYTRRSGTSQKYGAAIWFSRSNGKGEDGEADYIRIITFKDLAPAEPLPDYVIKSLR